MIESKKYNSDYALRQDLNNYPEWKVIGISDSIRQYSRPLMINGEIKTHEHCYTLFYEIDEGS